MFGMIGQPPLGPAMEFAPRPAVPVGAIIAYAGPLPPYGPPAAGGTPAVWPVETSGWMVCDGRTLTAAQYPLLFRVIGYQYGGSPGSGEFAIPDLQGQFLRGVATTKVQDPGLDTRTAANPSAGSQDPVGSIEKCALQTHEHVYLQGGEGPAGDKTPEPGPAPPSKSTLTSGPTSSLSPPGDVLLDPAETRPKNVFVYFLIRFA